MPLSKLTDLEKNILLQLFYLDLPPLLEVEDISLTIEEVLYEVENNIDIHERNPRLENIRSFIETESYKNSNLAKVERIAYQNHSQRREQHKNPDAVVRNYDPFKD